jgi:hypothetical protein
LLTKYAKVVIIVCLALLVIAPWLLSGRRRRQRGGDWPTNLMVSDGSGGDDPSHHGHSADHGAHGAG